MLTFSLPRFVIAGLAGSTGKTLVTVGLARALKRRGLRVAAFKKGPDYIDPAWLGTAAGSDCRTLDAFLMSKRAVAQSLASARGADVAVIEGNRGLFDGHDADGTYSTAELAKQIHAPVVLVVDVSKATRTVAALVLGCLTLDPRLRLGGVILNKVGSARHERTIREALTKTCDVPVLGAIPRLSRDHLPSRHLGLVLPGERDDRDGANDSIAQIADAIEQSVDVEAVHCLAETAPHLTFARVGHAHHGLARPHVQVGFFRDQAFSFYYPENLAALQAEGARLVPISPLRDDRLPRIDALYVGGGYPEEHAATLAANEPMRAAVADGIRQGLPVWAECGGLMYLAAGIVKDCQRYPMVGALPVDVEQTRRPQAHGYVEGAVDSDNPYLAPGTKLRGHEFHYSRLLGCTRALKTAVSLRCGAGIGDRRDGILVGNVFASYLHLFAPGAPDWAPAFIERARDHARSTQPTETGDHRGIHDGTGHAH